MKNCAKCIHHKVCASYLEDIGLAGDNWEHDMSLCCEDFADSSQFAPVVHGRWVSLGPHNGHKCGACEDYHTDDADNLFWCPRCGATMTEIEKLEYRRYDLPIGAPYPVTICEHKRTDKDNLPSGDE